MSLPADRRDAEGTTERKREMAEQHEDPPKTPGAEPHEEEPARA